MSHSCIAYPENWPDYLYTTGQPPRRHTAVKKVITISEPRRQEIIKSNPPLKVPSVPDQASGRDEKSFPTLKGGIHLMFLPSVASWRSA